MKLAVVSHKLCWRSDIEPGRYRTDGGFPMQMKAISELFDETAVIVPCEAADALDGVTPLAGQNLRVVPLTLPKGTNLRRKLNFPLWLFRNAAAIWREVKAADAVHAPIPGDVGTIGMIAALLHRKPLFVRYCGNWALRRTAAEWFWHSIMERFAGGRNVMLATGGSDDAPSEINPNIKWIFSTSLTRNEVADSAHRELPANGELKLIIACRQEKEKGAEVVIRALRLLTDRYPAATLDVVGDGGYLDTLKSLARELDLQERVVFHGRVDPKQVVRLLKRSHVFCFPTWSSEGFPKAVVEALASGLPVVTTPVSVLPKLITTERGKLIDSPTPEKVAEAVESICADPSVYRGLSQAAIAAAQDYTLENWRDLIGDRLRDAWGVESLSSAVQS